MSQGGSGLQRGEGQLERGSWVKQNLLPVILLRRLWNYQYTFYIAGTLEAHCLLHDWTCYASMKME